MIETDAKFINADHEGFLKIKFDLSVFQSIREKRLLTKLGFKIPEKIQEISSKVFNISSV